MNDEEEREKHIKAGLNVAPLSLNKGLSPCCALISSQHFEGCGLSCPVHSQQPKALPRTNPQTQTVHRQDPAHLARLVHL